MCGFCGTTSDNRIFVEKAINKLRHRGPDEVGVTQTPFGILGHARLSIVDVARSHQPMTDGAHWIVFNGEIYNYRELRTQFRCAWQTDGDTETVLRLWNHEKESMVNGLDGMFAMAVWGPNLFLARDPLGIKPLYYAKNESGMYFASEIKALIDIPGDIYEFPAGHWWDEQHGFVRYFNIDDLQWNQSLPRYVSSAEIDTRIRDTLRCAVQKRLIADPDIPVGVSLSGGLDSSLIAALARESRANLDTFVVGMEGSEDVEYSREVADALGTRHHVYIYSFQEMLGALPDVIYHLESYDAALVRSAIPNYFLALLAAQTVKVILTGEGADELFGGYEYLRGVTDPRQFQREIWTITSNLHNTNLQRTDRMTMAHSIEGRVPFLDTEMIRLALSLPPELKFHDKNGIAEKALLRRAFEGFLPGKVLHRPKQKFSQGAGSRDLLAEYANGVIPDAQFYAERNMFANAGIRSKEELLYFRHFRAMFGDRIPPERVGRTRSVTDSELN